MSPLGQFRKLVKHVRAMLCFCGADMFDENYTVLNPVFMVLLVFLAIYAVCFINTIYDGFVTNNDWTIILQCLAIGSLAVQHLDNIYDEYQNRGSRYEYALKKTLQRVAKCSKIAGVIYFTSVAGLIVLPIIYVLITGKRELTLTALIPGIDPKELLGYFIHTGFHSAIIFFGGVGFFCSDTIMFSMLLHVLLHRDIMKAKFHDLNEITEQEDKPVERSRSLLNDIIAWHQKYNLYNFIFKNDDVTRMIYEVCIWYRLKVKEQKMILLMLRKSQNAAKLTVGKIMALNFSTALQLSKGIYTFLMLLINFLE
ncbi:odorant receptor 67d-like [Glossina fuscipes]|uniref:Odorant receptor 67d-like n=1 Tax=Glossina fuscipes TaxID=7396 RepID=A0A8U0W9M5_9MUSC|nr:odorant receptor 67d-like [Glossina fuscipes]